MPKPAKAKTSKTLGDSLPVPDLAEAQVIAQSLGCRGRDIHELLLPDGSKTMATMLPKYRGVIWIKEGIFVVFEPRQVVKTKIGGEIISVLQPHHIEALHARGDWPQAFEQSVPSRTPAASAETGSLSDSSNDGDLFVNVNRPTVSESDDETDESTESDDVGSSANENVRGSESDSTPSATDSMGNTIRR